VREWGQGTVILSPRDLTRTQLASLAADVCKAGGSVYLDPQFYIPHADHERLTSHDYWPQEYDSMGFWSGADLRNLLTSLHTLHQQLCCARMILPGLYASRVDADWLERQRAVIDDAPRAGIPRDVIVATVALSAEATRSEEQIHAILDDAGRWAVDAVYLVCEHPNGEYLITDPNWLANVLDLVAGLRLKGKEVILGYCNQQMLISACSSANAIASGTWMNVRSFPPDKFRLQYEEEVKTRTTWYYCPHGLSEYKIPFLDIALRLGVLPQMAPAPELGSRYSDIPFRGAQPSTVQFTEQAAFRHYLQCLRSQALAARRPTFDETSGAHEAMLDGAERLLNRLHSAGVRGGHRDFREIIDVNRAALGVLRVNRAPVLRRYWSRL
jgi:hypothetical protein